jgi:hypothetical protein
MTLLEMQTLSKADFNNKLQSAGTNFNNLDHKTADMAERLAEYTGTVLTNMNIPSGEQSSYADFRTMLTEFQTWLDGTYSDQTVIPRNIIELFRNMR